MIQEFGPSFCSFEIFTELSILSRIEDQFLLTWEPAELAEEEIWSQSERNRWFCFVIVSGKMIGKRGRAAVVVMGDLGRSPRMQYHALSLARQVRNTWLFCICLLQQNTAVVVSCSWFWAFHCSFSSCIVSDAFLTFYTLPVFWIFFRCFFNVIAAVLEKQTMMGEICYICMAGWSGGWFSGFCRYFLPSFFPAAFLQSPRSVAIGRQKGSVQELILLSADYKEILSKIALCLQLCMLGFCRNVHWNNEADFVKISGGWLFECRNRTSCGTPATFTCSSASHGKCSFLFMSCCSQYKMTCSMLEDSYP